MSAPIKAGDQSGTVLYRLYGTPSPQIASGCEGNAVPQDSDNEMDDVSQPPSDALVVDPDRGPTVSCPAEGWWISLGAVCLMVYYDGNNNTLLTVTYGDGTIILDVEQVAIDTCHPPQSPWMQHLVQRLGRSCDKLDIKLELKPDDAAQLVRAAQLLDMEGK